MAKLNWLETFELGVPEIDDDHRQMLAVMRRVESAADEEDFDSCAALLDQLIEVSKDHFKREEDLLERAEYPHVDLHREYHSGLLARAEAVIDICKGIKTRENFKECCREMFGFLVDDVVAGDLNFKSFLQEKGISSLS